MFIWSMRVQKYRAFLIIGAVILVVAVGLIWWTVASGKENPLEVNSTAEMITYIESHGWEVDPIPTEEVEVTVPDTFDEVYTNYNEIQLRQGFDLTTYQGKLVKRTTFILLNYPDFPDNMRVDVLTHENLIVGADVCSLEIRGMMHGISELPENMVPPSGTPQGEQPAVTAPEEVDPVLSTEEEQALPPVAEPMPQTTV